ncbi:DUF2075 domain-containing protein [Phytohabitans aurantiacus]|uniref:DUF2075 domain-containing protein n=1 Tax=Phytohabitans aurantiacus TaxID=3016789 RepID=UPI00249181BF|nr:DUF2075 domain-containing protein [Phytohabitans aurantiacus]
MDEQRVAYELVLHKVQQAREQDIKSVVVVAGGPGSGKSVIALSVLAELARQGYPVLHATGSNSFTESMRRYAGRGSSRIKEIFKCFNFFVDARRNGLDVLVCDEAHRIRRNSLSRFMSQDLRVKAAGRLQLDELIAAARVPMFLLDEHQVVRPGELGTVDIIRRRAGELGLDFEFVPLHGQFRCGGSEAYEHWVLDLLGLEGRQPSIWAGDGRFDVRMADSPFEMEAVLAEWQSMGGTARISAGFCWPWSKPLPDGSLVDDVQIGDWRRPWNANSDRSIGGAPGKAYWATDPAGFGQVGCVYTAQGFEYDWSAVIIGPDLVARDGQLVTRRLESRDPELKGNKATDERADQLIRNTYKVLLTRGMRGTVIYTTDAETREYIRQFVKPQRGLETRYASAEPGCKASGRCVRRTVPSPPTTVGYRTGTEAGGGTSGRALRLARRHRGVRGASFGATLGLRPHLPGAGCGAHAIPPDYRGDHCREPAGLAGSHLRYRDVCPRRDRSGHRPAGFRGGGHLRRGRGRTQHACPALRTGAAGVGAPPRRRIYRRRPSESGGARGAVHVPDQRLHRRCADPPAAAGAVPTAD